MQELFFRKSTLLKAQLHTESHFIWSPHHKQLYEKSRRRVNPVYAPNQLDTNQAHPPRM